MHWRAMAAMHDGRPHHRWRRARAGRGGRQRARGLPEPS